MELPVKGLVHVTGEPDTGKTTLALTVPGVQPSEIIFFDDDKKTQSIADSLKQSGTPFGYYINLSRETSGQKTQKPIDFWKLLNTHLEKAKSEVPNAKVLVFDNFDRSEAAIRAYSMSIMESISEMSAGQIKAMSQMTWAYTYNIYGQFLDQLNAIAPLVFVITHTRFQWIRNTKTNILESKGQKPIVEKANLRIWTRHNAKNPAPIGLVLKRIQQMRVTPEGIQAINVLPRRLSPCTWEKIIWYLNNPVGDRPPTGDENLTPQDLSILDGELTEDQKDAWRIARISAESSDDNDVEDLGLNPIAVSVRLLREEGKSPPVIASELGISVVNVLELLK